MGDSSEYDTFTVDEGGADAQGWSTKVTVRVGQEKDSIFSRQPPPLAPNDFIVEGRGGANPGPGPPGRPPEAGQ